MSVLPLTDIIATLKRDQRLLGLDLGTKTIGLALSDVSRTIATPLSTIIRKKFTQDAEMLLATLVVELQRLADTAPELVDTTMVIHPRVFTDFEDFNDFLELADAALDDLDLDGVLQVASFHPRFQFADTEPDDITNATNRSPYPTLHLLREDSVDRAVAAFPQAEAIFERNMETLEKLGPAGWAELKKGWEADAAGESAG